MHDEREARVFLEPPIDPEDLPEQTRQNFAKIAPLHEFISSVVAPNMDTNTGLLCDDVDWSREIEKFNKGSGEPEISLDEVAKRLERIRAPEERVRHGQQIANELRSWLQRNQ